ASLGRSDWSSLAKLRDRLGQRFIAGLVVNTGERILPAGDRLWAMPVSGLWSR
ncbi:MAG: ATP-binding protein, partial [Propionibacteriaceae bacterium]|nr:ATP-binding protein [Propionibacteriaceae bacterium]